MNLQELYYGVTTTKEVAVIGREFSAYGMEYALVGLMNTENKTELVLLEYDQSRDDYYNCREPENLTNREAALSVCQKKTFTDLLESIVIDGKVFYVEGSHGCTLDSGLDSDLYVLAEFIKQGWKSEKFFDYSPECVDITFFELEEKLDNLAQLDLSRQIKLRACETTEKEFPQIRLNLPVEKDIDKTFSLFGGKEEICIKRVHLVDLSESENIDEEHISMICPNKMRLPVIEYTCTCDTICLDISLKSHLDSLYSDSYNGFATEDGVFCVAVGIELTGETEDRKFYTVQQAVKAEAKRIECEIVSCSKEIENPVVEEFLI